MLHLWSGLCIYDVQQLNGAGSLCGTLFYLGCLVGVIPQYAEHVFGPASFVILDIHSMGITISNASTVSSLQFWISRRLHCLL